MLPPPPPCRRGRHCRAVGYLAHKKFYHIIPFILTANMWLLKRHDVYIIVMVETLNLVFAVFRVCLCNFFLPWYRGQYN